MTVKVARVRTLGELKEEFERINRILIPKTRKERENFDRSRFARVIRRIALAVERFTEDGQLYLAFIPLSALAALDVGHSQVYFAWAILSALFFASAIAARFFSLEGVRTRVITPRRVTVGEECDLVVELRNDSSVTQEAIRITGPFLGWDGYWSKRKDGIARLAPGTSARTLIRARFVDRGDHSIEPIRVQRIVPLGLALGPILPAHAAKIKVVPRITNVVTLDLDERRRQQPGGVPRASRMADSRELMGVRPYRSGDPMRDLHARTWARIGVPAVREFQEEYFSRVAIVLDTELGLVEARKFEAAVSLVAGVTAKLCSSEALVDVMLLGDALHSFTVGRSLGTLDLALDLLSNVEADTTFDATKVLSRLSPRLSRISSVIFVSLHWDDAREALARHVRSRGVAFKPLIVRTREAEEGSAIRVIPSSAIFAREAIRC